MYHSCLTLISTSHNYPDLRLQSCLFPSGFQTKITYAHISFPRHTRTMCTRLYNGMNLQPIWVDDLHNIWQRIRIAFIWMMARNQWWALVETEWTFTFLITKISSSPGSLHCFRYKCPFNRTKGQNKRQSYSSAVFNL